MTGFKVVRFLATVGVVLVYVMYGLTPTTAVVGGLTASLWFMRQCTSYHPGGLVRHKYGRTDSIGGILGTRIDTNMYRCKRFATRYLFPTGIHRGGFFCAGHAQEAQKYRR